MIGIKEIGSYIPSERKSNLERLSFFDTDEDFIRNKIGITHVSRKLVDEDVSDMCVKAFNNLCEKIEVNIQEIEVLILVTQNPDRNIPHSSAEIHGKLNLPVNCAAFDVSLGCSGFVYGLSVIESFMQSNGMKKGLLFTCDPYSKVINPNDRSTELLFGDAAAVAYITDNAELKSGRFTFGTIGNERENLVCNSELFMNGRGIFNFAAKYVPADFANTLSLNGAKSEEMDYFIFHQGSKYIVDTLTRRLRLDPDKIAYDITEYGNTVSSSIPIILEKALHNKAYNKIYICGFGVGLSWSSTILTRN